MKDLLVNKSKKILLILSLIIFSLIVILFTSAITASADGNRMEIKKDDMASSAILNGGFQKQNFGQYDATVINSMSKDTTQIGLNSLYGSDERSYVYYGEISRALAEGWKNGKKDDKEAEKWNKYPYLSTHIINGYDRKWAFVSGGDGKDWKTINADGTISDLHLVQRTYVGVGDIIVGGLADFSQGVASGLNKIASWVVRFFISVSNTNISGMLDIIGWQKFLDKVNELFLFKGNTMSPVLVVALALFLGGLIGVVIKMLKGCRPAREIAREAIILVGAMILAGVCISGGLSTIVNSSVAWSTKLISTITNSTNDTSLYLYKSGRADDDANNTMIGLSAMPYINQIIRNQFYPYNIDELRLWSNDDAGVAQNNWGKSTQEIKNIVSELTGDSDNINAGPSSVGDDLFTIYTGKNKNSEASNKKEPNLGLYWYANMGGVNTEHPWEWDSDSGKVKVNAGDKNANLYIVDFLNRLDGDTNGSTKAQTILKQFYSPTRDASGMWLVFLVSVALCFALSFAVVQSFVGKLIFNVGVIALPIVPILLLIPQGNMRRQVKQLLHMWFNAALRMFVGQVFIVIVLVFSSELCKGGAMGYLIDIIFLIAVGKKGPDIMNKIMELSGRSGITAEDKYTRGCRNWARKVGGKRLPRRGPRTGDGGIDTGDSDKGGADFSDLNSENADVDKKAQEGFSNFIHSKNFGEKIFDSLPKDAKGRILQDALTNNQVLTTNMENLVEKANHNQEKVLDKLDDIDKKRERKRAKKQKKIDKWTKRWASGGVVTGAIASLMVNKNTKSMGKLDEYFDNKIDKYKQRQVKNPFSALNRAQRQVDRGNQLGNAISNNYKGKFYQEAKSVKQANANGNISFGGNGNNSTNNTSNTTQPKIDFNKNTDGVAQPKHFNSNATKGVEAGASTQAQQQVKQQNAGKVAQARKNMKGQ